jgi:transposase
LGQISKHILPIPQDPTHDLSTYAIQPNQPTLSWMNKTCHVPINPRCPLQPRAATTSSYSHDPDEEEEEEKKGSSASSCASSFSYSAMVKERKRVDVARRSKKVAPEGCVLRCWKIKLKPDQAFKQRAQQWFRICRLWRKLILKHLRKKYQKGFKSAPDWKEVKKLLVPCECPGIFNDPEAKCPNHPFWRHKMRHYLFNLPHPDPSKRRMEWKGKGSARHQVENHNFCTFDMKVATIHKLCASIGSTIESLKEKKRLEQGKVSRDDVFHIPSFELEHQTQQDRCQSVYIECNGGKPSITWNATDGFFFTPQYNPGSVRAKNKRDYRKLYAIFRQQNEGHHFTRPIRDSFVGCASSVTLKFDRNHGYFLCIPYWKKKTTEYVQPRHLAVALDPGVRSFQTTYDSVGTSTKYGYRSIEKLMTRAKRMDQIQSRLDQIQPRLDLSTPYQVLVPLMEEEDDLEFDASKPIEPTSSTSADSVVDPTPERPSRVYLNRCKTKALKRQRRAMAAKIDNLKTDVHWKLANELCASYEHVMIPVFKVSQMVNRFKRKIRCRTVREMLHWSHYAFRQRLICKGEEWSTTVHEVGEEYTTKGCPHCGSINQKIGGSEWFSCRQCGYECDRDRGASRSIYLKNIETCVGPYSYPSSLASQSSASATSYFAFASLRTVHTESGLTMHIAVASSNDHSHLDTTLSSQKNKRARNE